MNILYQKAKLLGRPFRIYEDEEGTSYGGGSSAEQDAINDALSGVGDTVGDDSGGIGFDIGTITGGGTTGGGTTVGSIVGGGSDDDATGGVSTGWLESLPADFDWSKVDFGTEAGSYSDPEMRAEIDALIEAGNGMTGGTQLDFLKKLPKGLWDAVKGAFQDKNGKYDFAKLGAAGGALMSLTGLGKAKPGGYQGKVPELTATRQQIKYDDPNRRAGAGGRDYFTDTTYTPSADTAGIAAAREAAKGQAEGILAGYKKADAPAEATTKFARPYEKAAATTGAATTGAATTGAATTGATTGAATTGIAAALPVIPNALDIAKQTYPEKFVDDESRADFVGPRSTPPAVSDGPPELNADIGQFAQQRTLGFAQGGQAMKEPRYLRGITDGMEDKINTSIDGQQPAKLSHGEFVIPADVVSHLGNGNSDAGAKKLYQMMDRLRQARTGTKKQGKQINPDKFMPGGSVGYQSGGIVAFNAGGTTSTAIDTTTSSGLAPYAGDYITKTLGEAQAAAAQPYQAYGGPLTAGASDLQTSAFQGVKDMASTGYSPTTFTSGTFDTAAANKYMNPYLEASLNPQMKELRRQAQINNMGSLAKAGRAGAMSGDSRNLMESEGIRNLLSKQSDVLGQGYATAYDKAMGQFNTEQGRNMDAQKASEASRVYSADYSKGLLGDMAALGKTQRDIEAEGIAADKTEFEKQRDYDKEMAQYKIGMLQKLPVGSTTTEANTNPVTDYLKNSATIIKLFQGMGLIPK
jgi:hypothetical protein